MNSRKSREMIRFVMFLCLLSITVFSRIPLAVAADFFVAPDGLDDNPGTQALPWRTIQHAAESLMPGDSVSVRAGTYAEHVIPQRSGTASAPIHYRAFPGESPVIDGASIELPEWTGLVDLTGLSHIRVSGFRIQNAGPTLHNSGILADTADSIVIEHNTTVNTTESGILVWNASRILIDGNTVESACTYMYNECITVGASTRCDICNNLVFNSPKEGICVKDGSSYCRVFGNTVHHTEATGFYVDAQAEHTHSIEVFNNVSYDGVEDGFTVASEVGGLLEHVLLYNNIAYNNGWVGFDISECCIETHPIHDVVIINNTSVGNGIEWGGGIVVQNPQVEGIVIRNNITSDNLSFQIAATTLAPSGAIVVDHNLIDGFREGEDETRGTDFVEGSPEFVSASTHDYHLLTSSPAIGRAALTGVPGFDMDLGARWSASPDIGADEYSDMIPAFSTALWMPSEMFRPADRCALDAVVRSASEPIDSTPIVCVLDVLGEYWFWPDWGHAFAFGRVSASPGYHVVSLLQEFAWPDTGSDAFTGIVFWAAMTNEEFTEILGGEQGLGRWEFGFGG